MRNMANSNYHLKFNPISGEDLDEIYGYISTKHFAEMAAIKLMDKIENAIKRLARFPFTCSLVSDKLLKNKGYRKLIVDNYIVFYLLNEAEKQVIIMRILYGASKYQDVL